MHLACRYGSSRNAVKLVQPRPSWLPTHRLYTTTQSRLRAYHHDPERQPSTLLGSYIPNPVPNQHAKHIAVLGGGISGLATAFNLAKDIPNAKITVFESKDRLGGWMESEQVEVDDGTVLFEWGPRSLRPHINGNGIATLQLINQLGEDLKKSIRGVTTSSPAATNRFIYYPDHLVRVPAPSPNSGMLTNIFNIFRTVLSEPAFKGVLPALIAEPTIDCRPNSKRDESVGSFVSRRFGTAAADNLLSALFHGIYAGDIYKLSARTLLPALWYLENRDQDGNGIATELMELVFRGHRLAPFDQVRFMNRFKKDDVGDSEAFNFALQPMRHTSVYSFVKGLGQLNDAIVQELEQKLNVTLKRGSAVNSLSFDISRQKISLTTASNATPETFDYAVCTLSPNHLHQFLEPKDHHKTLRTALTRNGQNFPSVNVMVVNLYYKSESLPHPPGFGYLIPRSVPADQNPERALGVIFSSQTAGPKGKAAVAVSYKDWEKYSAERDKRFGNRTNVSPEEHQQFVEDMQENEAERIQLGQDTASGTKLAVMIGGHWWDGWAESDLPTEAEGIEMAKSVIARHLGITESPMLAKARLQRDCIPQYQVGYRDDMAKIHQELLGKDGFEGRMKVTGPWWQGGVGVNDCVKTARETSRRIREGCDDETGLEGYVGQEKWVLIDNKTTTEVMDPLQK